MTFKEKIIKLFKIFLGYITYRNFKDKKNCYVTYMGLGDTLIFSGLLYKYKEIYPEKKISLIVPLNHKEIAEGYNKYIDELIILPNKKMEDLAVFVGSRFFVEKDRVKPILPKEGFKFIGIKEINYYNLFEIQLGITLDNEVKGPKFEIEEYELEKLVKEYDIVKNKSVVIAPYARSVEKIGMEVWEKIATYLKDKGYKVFTNVKDSREEPIKGTFAIQLNLKEIYYISKICKYVITLRSGLSDLLSFSGCKLMVLYENETDYNNFKMKTGNTRELLYSGTSDLIKDVEKFIR